MIEARTQGWDWSQLKPSCKSLKASQDALPAWCRLAHRFVECKALGYRLGGQDISAPLEEEVLQTQEGK